MRAGLVGRNSLLLACLALVALAVAGVSPANRQGLNSPNLRAWPSRRDLRYVSSLGWNGEYWLMTTSDGWLVRLNGSDFTAVGRVSAPIKSFEWSGKYWLGIGGIYYVGPFAYDGQNLTRKLTYGVPGETATVAYAGDTCVVLNWVPYTWNYSFLTWRNYSILTWDGGPISVLVEDAVDLLPCREKFEHREMRLSVELLTNGTTCLIYACCSVMQCHALYIYDGKDLINLSWALPNDIMLWEAPPTCSRWIWGEVSNGTHWLAPSGASRRLFLFNGREFEEVEGNPSLLRFESGAGWNGDYWLIYNQERLLRLEGGRLELAADLAGLGLEFFTAMPADWNGEYWLIPYDTVPADWNGENWWIPYEFPEEGRSFLVKYDGEEWELVPPPPDLSASRAPNSSWSVCLNGLAWGDQRWLIAAREPGDWQFSRGYLLSYDGRKFEDIMQGLDEAIELEEEEPPAHSKIPFEALMALVLLGVSFLLAKPWRSANSL